MRIRVTMPDGTEQKHRIRTWGEFRRFVAAHRKHAGNVSVEPDGDDIHFRVYEDE